MPQNIDSGDLTRTPIAKPFRIKTIAKKFSLAPQGPYLSAGRPERLSLFGCKPRAIGVPTTGAP